MSTLGTGSYFLPRTAVLPLEWNQSPCGFHPSVLDLSIYCGHQTKFSPSSSEHPRSLLDESPESCRLNLLTTLWGWSRCLSRCCDTPLKYVCTSLEEDVKLYPKCSGRSMKSTGPHGSLLEHPMLLLWGTEEINLWELRGLCACCCTEFAHYKSLTVRKSQGCSIISKERSFRWKLRTSFGWQGVAEKQLLQTSRRASVILAVILLLQAELISFIGPKIYFSFSENTNGWAFLTLSSSPTLSQRPLSMFLEIGFSRLIRPKTPNRQ